MNSKSLGFGCPDRLRLKAKSNAKSGHTLVKCDRCLLRLDWKAVPVTKETSHAAIDQVHARDAFAVLLCLVPIFGFRRRRAFGAAIFATTTNRNLFFGRR